MVEMVEKVAREYGLFVALVAYVIWDARIRESRYIIIIDKLSDSFREIKDDVEEIKDRLKIGRK